MKAFPSKRFLLLLTSLFLLLPLQAWGEGERAELLRVVFFDCGKADSILIQTGEHAVLIDAATDEAGQALPQRLKDLGVIRLSALIITHPHKDHIGGAEHILRAFPVEQVLLGPLVVRSKQVEQFEAEMKAQGKTPRLLSPGEAISLGEASLLCIGPLDVGAQEENDLSLILRLSYGETAFLFTGDAQRQALSDLLAMPQAGQLLPANVLKVPHHGAAETNTHAFFEAVAPDIAVIPTRQGTKDKLPDRGVITALADLEIQTYLTDGGDVFVLSDGAQVWAYQEVIGSDLENEIPF